MGEIYLRIKQCEYAEARMGKFFYFLEKYNLKKYYSPKEPAIFFGMYSGLTLKTLKNHKNLAIVIWRGSDIISPKKRLQSVLSIKNVNIKHIAISRFIAKDLEKKGVPYKLIPLSATKVEDLDVYPLGDEIYAYMSKKRFDFYGGPIIKKLSKMCKYKINIADSTNSFTRKQLIEVYKKSFLGLRLTQHDGIANQVIEMGMMGRKCIHNGDHPSCIGWKSLKDILKNIEIESKNIGTTNLNICLRTKRYIDVGQEWLDTDFWR